MKIAVVVAALVLSTGIARGSDPSEEGVPTSPLKIYSGGLGIGAVRPLNVEMEEVSGQFLKLSLVNSLTVTRNVELFIDADWLLPGKNGGGVIGIDWMFLSERIRPFAGIGAGAYHIDHGGSFGDNFGISLTAHAGAIFEVTDNVALRIRVPYYAVFNSYYDHGAGLEGGLIFSSRFKHVRKLNYR